MPLINLVRSYARKLLTSRGTGITQIPNRQQVDVLANNILSDFRRHKISSNVLKTEQDVKNMHNYIDSLDEQKLEKTFEKFFSPSGKMKLEGEAIVKKGLEGLEKKTPFHQGFTPTIVKDKTLFKDSPERIAKIKAENKAAAERLKAKKKIDLSKYTDEDLNALVAEDKKILAEANELSGAGINYGRVQEIEARRKEIKKILEAAQAVPESGYGNIKADLALQKQKKTIKPDPEDMASGGLARVGYLKGKIVKGILSLGKKKKPKINRKLTKDELDDLFEEFDEAVPYPMKTVGDKEKFLKAVADEEAAMFAEYKAAGGSKRPGGPKDPMADAIENASPGYTGDLKYDAQMLADDLAEQRFGKAFDDLSRTQQSDLYSESYKALSGQRADYIKNKNLSKPTKTLEGIKKEGTIDISDPEIADEFSKFMKESDPKGYKDLEQKIQLSNLDIKGKKGHASGGIAGQLHLNQGGRARFAYGTPAVDPRMKQSYAQNRAENEAARLLNAQMRSAGGVGPGGGSAADERQAFFNKYIGAMPEQRALGIDSMGYDTSRHSDIIKAIAQKKAQEERGKAALEAQQGAIAARKAQAEDARRKAAIEGAYGKAGDYGFEAQLLGMSPSKFYEHMLIGNPKGITDAGAQGIKASHMNPYNIYYQNELIRQKEAGLPAAMQIQYGQVMNPNPGGLPGGLPPGGPVLPVGPGGSVPSSTPSSMYIPYADAVSGLKQQYGSDPYTISGYGAPQDDWDQFQTDYNKFYAKGGRASLSNGGLAKILGA